MKYFFLSTTQKCFEKCFAQIIWSFIVWKSIEKIKSVLNMASNFVVNFYKYPIDSQLLSLSNTFWHWKILNFQANLRLSSLINLTTFSEKNQLNRKFVKFLAENLNCVKKGRANQVTFLNTFRRIRFASVRKRKNLSKSRPRMFMVVLAKASKSPERNGNQVRTEWRQTEDLIIGKTFFEWSRNQCRAPERSEWRKWFHFFAQKKTITVLDPNNC